jgi:hypothetical protein
VALLLALRKKPLKEVWLVSFGARTCPIKTESDPLIPHRVSVKGTSRSL